MLSGLDRPPLAAGVGAFGLEHLEPAVAFAVILALAVVLGGLAVALALTAIHTEAPALEGLGIGRGDSVAPEMIRAAAVMAILVPDSLVSFIFLSSRMSFEFRGTGGGKSRLSSHSGESVRAFVTPDHACVRLPRFLAGKMLLARWVTKRGGVG